MFILPCELCLWLIFSSALLAWFGRVPHVVCVFSYYRRLRHPSVTCVCLFSLPLPLPLQILSYFAGISQLQKNISKMAWLGPVRVGLREGWWRGGRTAYWMSLRLCFSLFIFLALPFVRSLCPVWCPCKLLCLFSYRVSELDFLSFSSPEQTRKHFDLFLRGFCNYVVIKRCRQ